MNSSESGHNEPTRPLWSATREGKIWSYLGRSGLPELFGSKWLGIGLFFFCFVFFATPSRSINAPEKQKERGQYPAILKALLVNNLYMFGSRIATANLSGPLISYVHIHIN